MGARCLAAVIFLTFGLQVSWAAVDDTSLPQIQIVSPIDGTKYQAKASVSVAIQGMHVPDVVHVVQLLQNGTSVRSVVLDPLGPDQTHPVAFEFTFDLDSLRVGHYTFLATIDDVSSNSVTVVVKRDRWRHR